MKIISRIFTHFYKAPVPFYYHYTTSVIPNFIFSPYWHENIFNLRRHGGRRRGARRRRASPSSTPQERLFLATFLWRDKKVAYVSKHHVLSRF